VVVCCSGKLEAPPGQWDDLCADVRPLILGSLSLRGLASAAPTCREFRQAFLARMQEERARLISVGEELYGKKVFTGFVKAFRRLLRRDFDAYPGFCCGDNILLINADGEAAVVTGEEWKTRLATGFPPWISRIDFNGGLMASLGTGLFASPQTCSAVNVDVQTTREGAIQWDVVALTFGVCNREAAVGFLLASCDGNSEDPPAPWHSPFSVVTLDMWELEDDAGKRVAEDIVGPLRFLAESVSYGKPVCHALQSSKGEDSSRGYPLGHLVVYTC
jgi:hypothetical protein